MLQFTIDLSPSSADPAKNAGDVYEGCEISLEAGRFSIENPSKAIQLVHNNIATIPFGLECAMVKVSSYCLTGGAPIWSYLSAINALKDKQVFYSDGRQINNFPIHAYQIAIESVTDEPQQLDIGVKADQVVDGKVVSGLLKGIAATVSGGRVSIEGDKAEACEILASNIALSSNNVVLTGGMPIWLYLTVCRSLIQAGVKVVYADGRGGEFSIN
ncbi:MAG: hypothetical protein ACRCXZ_00435 [Patescibacteria group bacterium]